MGILDSNRGFAFQAAARYNSGMVPVLATALDASSLRGLLLSCAQHDAQPIGSEPLVTTRALAIREQLRGLVLDSYIRVRPASRLCRYPVLTVFVMNGGSAIAAAMQYALAEWSPAQRAAQVRNAQLWTQEYLEFAADKLEELEEVRRRSRVRHERDYQAAAVQCAEVCGRTSNGPPKGSSGRGCTGCPMHGV